MQRNSCRTYAHSTNPKHDAGLRRLASASLKKAIEDAADCEPQTAYSATRWLAGDTSDGLTFARCCEVIGIAPESLRRSVCRRYGAIRLRLTQYEKVLDLSSRVTRDAF